jgi:outer membrane protein OmpA-like peptidoglycan-associated protein
VTHLAYLADQRVTMAQETASARIAQADVARAGGERDKLRLAMRTREADAAQAQLSASKQINAQQGSDLAAARSSTQRGNERINDLEQELSKLGARKTDQGMVVTLGGVLFYTGQARLLPAARHDMSKLAEFFKRNPQRSARIEGNTDSVGGNEDNMDLSQRRATAVKNALTELGVSSERLSTAANGEDKPAATNDTSAGRQMNRRVEIIFSPMQDAVSTN